MLFNYAINIYTHTDAHTILYLCAMFDVLALICLCNILSRPQWYYPPKVVDFGTIFFLKYSVVIYFTVKINYLPLVKTNV